MALTEIISKNWLDCAFSRRHDKKNTFHVVISGFLNGSGDHGDIRQNGTGKETAV